METPPLAEPTINQDFLDGAYTPIGEDHDEKYGVPTLEELGWLIFLGTQKTSSMYCILKVALGTSLITDVISYLFSFHLFGV